MTSELLRFIKLFGEGLRINPYTGYNSTEIAMDTFFSNTSNQTVLMDSRKIDNKKMMDLGDELKSQIPGCGFAIIAFDITDGVSHGNYISNVNDEYMIKALEFQLAVLKRKTQ